MHPIHRRYHAEELVRLRRAAEGRRYAASQRQGRIDANPHQIDAVMFALRRIPEGGCILADEVGLGKTIEAGLVIAQMLAEGASRILIVLPRTLMGQWQQELYELFGIEAMETADDSVDINGGGVFLAGREYAGGERGFERLTKSEPFDLFVVDEAHELFAGIYRRFDRSGIYQEDSPHARTAHRVSKLMGASPVLLLTATPMQNSLLELWGLLHYIERDQMLLGSLPTFRDLFCEAAHGRTLADGQAHELRRRLGGVVQRTLRRQAQEFLDKPFVRRRAQLFEYSMSPEEKSLYDDVTAYLLEPDLCAFRGRSRQLLLIGFHRLMASSTAALASSLERVAGRLGALLNGVSEDVLPDTGSALMEDLEDDDAVEEGSEAAPPTSQRVQTEHDRVTAFVRRARALPYDSKAEALMEVVKEIGGRSDGNDKVVIFTESLTTQKYVEEFLIDKVGLARPDITLFRGNNEGPRATEALARWNADVGDALPHHARPSQAVALRLALVHEFKTYSRVFISTEAGAKGLNLQFCDTLINYDLPWNPQRIEQRIGRCHRYGQRRDVTVINFLAKDNEAQRLTFEILSTKLELFGQVLDMSDAVLHESHSDGSPQLADTLGPDFAGRLRRIWDRARSIGEVEDELRRLRDSIDERRSELERVRDETMGLIESRLDESVRQVFRRIQEELPSTLAELDSELERVAVAYLDTVSVGHTLEADGDRRVLRVFPSSGLPVDLADGFSVWVGHASDIEEGESLHPAHPLVLAAVAEARGAGQGSFVLRFRSREDSSEGLKERRGTRGRLALTRIEYRGFESEDRLVVTAVLEDAGVLRPEAVAHELLLLPCEQTDSIGPPLSVSATDLDEVIDEMLFSDQAGSEARESDNFERAIDQLEQYMEDRILVLRRGRAELAERLGKAEDHRDSALGSDKRAHADEQARKLQVQVDEMDEQIEGLVVRDDDDYRRWKDRTHKRRFTPPRSERLFAVEFALE
jgi:hypothetical protein